MAGAAKRRPLVEPRELFLQRFPTVPEVIAHAPLVRVRRDVFAGGQRRVARRRAEHHRASGEVNGFADRFNLSLVIGPAQIVHLHKVQVPRGEQLEDRVVVFLRARLGHVHAEHVRIPLAGAVRVRDGGGVKLGAENGRVAFHRLARNAAQQMQPELQTVAMHVIRERLEAQAVRGGGKFFQHRPEPAPFIHRHLRMRRVFKALRLRLVPLDVHDDVLPAVRGQFLRHVIRVGLGKLLGDGATEGIPTVPAHRRTRRPFEKMGGACTGRLPGQPDRQKNKVSWFHAVSL